MPLALTYDEVLALNPCEVRWNEVSRALGGKEGWGNRRIDAAAARAAGVTLDDLIWVASAVARTDADVARRLRLWQADCAAHVLHIYEAQHWSTVPRNTIIAGRAYARGEIDDAALNAAWATAKKYIASISTFDETWAAARAAEGTTRAVADADAAADAFVWAIAAAACAASEDTTWNNACAASAAAEAAEKEWQFDRLVLWLSDDEPEDLPLPKWKGECA
jgi:hypothetical protein